ncbi:Porphobilinogen deaminase [Smittium mucronatum]|uniref:hydroxymethylbilane synthase n=1 Tax=Smittium mucronatum TaxID=133383 RepID=A0A1R0GTH7_9FUNG|nr:Porphobilinogen deaminase [Smittium mucronatum]
MPPVVNSSKKNSGLPVTLNFQKQDTERLVNSGFADRLHESTASTDAQCGFINTDSKEKASSRSQYITSRSNYTTSETDSDLASEPNSITVGSRKSNLAVVQTKLVIKMLSEAFPKKSFPMITMSTTGDRVLDVSLSKIGEKSLFTKELEYALEDKSVDIVVHSLKDLPTVLPEGMEISSILKREDPRDVVIFPTRNRSKYSSLKDLPSGSKIGTSSVRRIAQLSKAYPGLIFSNIRGNLNTRFNKLEDESCEYSAIILAAAGVNRLGFSHMISEYLNDDTMYYAVGQGALGVETRSDDDYTKMVVMTLTHTKTLLECVAERGLMRYLEGGCSIPIGVWSSWVDSQDPSNPQPLLKLRGLVSSVDGQDSIKAEFCAPVFPENVTLDSKFSDLSHQNQTLLYTNAEKIGYKLGEIMNQMGASRILDSIPKH